MVSSRWAVGAKATEFMENCIQIYWLNIKRFRIVRMCRDAIKFIMCSGASVSSWTMPAVRPAVAAKCLFNLFGSKFILCGFGSSTRWITFHTAFGFFEDRKSWMKDFFAILIFVGFRRRWRYRCWCSLSCYWLCTGVVVGVVVRSWCVDAFRCQFYWLSQINPVAAVVTGIGLDFVWSLIISPYYSGSVPGFTSKSKWAHSHCVCFLLGGGGVGLWYVGCSILPAFSAEPLSAGWLWCGQQFCDLSRFAVGRKRCFTASTEQFLCRAGVCSFCGNVSQCRHCKIKVTSSLFATFTVASALPLACWYPGLLVRCSKPPFFGKFHKLVRCKLSPIVANDNVRDSVSGKVALEFPDASAGFGVAKSVNFPKVGIIVDQNKIR